MDGRCLISLCRICLEDGATIPIFETSIKENILSKIILCMTEKLEDIMGFPRNICTKCNETLDIVCSFISKYKESCKILENELLVVKKETFVLSDNEDNNIASEVEVEIKSIKTETDSYLNNAQNLVKLIKPLQLNIKKVKMKDEPKKRRNKASKINSGTNTNKIASSILEGDFSWTGEKWCIKIGQTKMLSNSNKKRAIIQKEIKKVVPEAPKVKEKSDTQKLCDLCGEVFMTSDKLLTHKKKIHLRTPVKCPKCPKILASDYCLSLHIKRKHEGKRDFICATCGKGFVFKKEMTDHFRKVHDKKPKPLRVFPCKFCEKTYKCAKSVVVHERSVHTGYRPAQCTICGSCFYHEDYLKEHVRLHTGETPYKCPVCGRGYAQSGNMKSHLRIHRISELDAITLSKMKPNYLKFLKVS